LFCVPEFIKQFLRRVNCEIFFEKSVDTNCGLSNYTICLMKSW